jgi:hypothetical protein
MSANQQSDMNNNSEDKKPQTRTIANHTAVRIAIDPVLAAAGSSAGQLVLAPFERREIACHELDGYDLKAWKRRGLISVQEQQANQSDGGSQRSDRAALGWALPLVHFAGAAALLARRRWPEFQVDGYLLLGVLLGLLALGRCMIDVCDYLKTTPAWPRWKAHGGDKPAGDPQAACVSPTRVVLAWMLLTGLLTVGVALLVQWRWPEQQLDSYLMVGGLLAVAALGIGVVHLFRLLGGPRFWSLLITCLTPWRSIPSILVVSLIVPVVAILLSKRGPEHPINSLNQLIADPIMFFSSPSSGPLDGSLLDLLLRLSFVLVATLLPALLLYLFHRQRLETLRESFLRDAIRLNPTLVTENEARTMYGGMIDDILGKPPEGKAPSSVLSGFEQLPVLISTFLFALGWSFTLIINGADAVSQELFGLHTNAQLFGFLGAYFFALNLIFRRYVRSDLNTKAYTHMAVRVLTTFVLIWVVSVIQVIEAGGPSAQAAGATSARTMSEISLYLLAFVVGIIPETATALLQDVLRRRWVSFVAPSLKEKHPLWRLDGITLYDQARLLEEGVENIETLAHHNLIELMLRTRIPAPRLVDLVDQAILYLHAQGPVQVTMEALAKEADEPELYGLWKYLRMYGIRTATDLSVMFPSFDERTAEIDEDQDQHQPDPDLKAQFGNRQQARLRMILYSLKDDEWMAYLLHWRRMRQACKYTYDLPEFEATFLGRAAAPESQATAKDTPSPAAPSQARGAAAVAPSMAAVAAALVKMAARLMVWSRALR